MTAAAAFLLAAGLNVDWWLLLATLSGTGLVIACGCVFNNYIDRDIDRHMARTKQRALVNDTVPVRSAMVYGTVLGLLGFTILAAYTNLLTVGLGVVGLIFYVVIYGVAKRHSVHGTLVGTIPGATPTLAGYCAVTGSFDSGAVILFLIMMAWQMAHFYSIGLYRLQDYRKAGLPVMPVKWGPRPTKLQIMAYIVGSIAATTALSGYGYTGYTYLVVMIALGLAWLGLGLRGFTTGDNQAWGRKMYSFSLLVLSSLSIMMAFNSLLS